MKINLKLVFSTSLMLIGINSAYADTQSFFAQSPNFVKQRLQPVEPPFPPGGPSVAQGRAIYMPKESITTCDGKKYEDPCEFMMNGAKITGTCFQQAPHLPFVCKPSNWMTTPPPGVKPVEPPIVAQKPTPEDIPLEDKSQSIK
jgi:hypothetical protein